MFLVLNGVIKSDDVGYYDYGDAAPKEKLDDAIFPGKKEGEGCEEHYPDEGDEKDCAEAGFVVLGVGGVLRSGKVFPLVVAEARIEVFVVPEVVFWVAGFVIVVFGHSFLSLL